MRVGAINFASGEATFAYADEWLNLRGRFPVSLTIPLGRGIASSTTIITWLMNLLPEGDALETLGRRFGVSQNDVLALMEIVGRDTAGALSIGRPRGRGGAEYRPIPTPAALDRIIEELPRRPFLAGDEGISMSLSGAQKKLPIAWDNGGFSIPLNGAPSTHIIKPDNPNLYGSVQNEALCMVLARRVGFQVAEVTTGLAGRRSYLLVSRYDRVHRSGAWRRLHQEDFCQAMTIPPVAKYQHNMSAYPGPGLADLVGVVKRHMTGLDITRFVDAVIFNVLITNVDSHAKNYSIMLRGNGVSLAPLYDLMCGDAWPEVTENLPQDIGGKRRARHVHQRHWRRMADECGLNATAIVRRVGELGGLVLAALGPSVDEVCAMPAGDHPMLSAFARAIQERCKTVLQNLEVKTGDEPETEDIGHIMDDFAPSGG